MTAQAVAVGLEQDSVAVEHEAWTLTEIGALCEVVNLATLCAHKTQITIWIALIADKFEHKPLAVGRPLVVEAAVGFIPSAAVGHLTGLLALEVHDHQAVATLDEGKFLAIGRILRHRTLHCGRGQK